MPEESQIRGLWLLSATVEDGRISHPGFFTRSAFGFSHYHKIGKYPRWVFWFYFLAIIGGLTLAIIIFAKLGKLKRVRLERKKAGDAEKQAISEILKRDPGFDLAGFKDRGRQIAERIQVAWSAGDMRPCRHLLSQGVYNRFRLQLKIMREIEKRRNAVSDFKINAFHIESRHKSGPYDALIVRLDAEARDVMVDASMADSQANSAAEKAPRTGFVEYYTFMRRRDAKTKSGTGIDTCGNCGTPFAAEGESIQCKSCKAVISSGNFDWVLAEITQAVEHGKGKRKQLAGKGVSADRLEDRASFIFWRDVMARLTGKKDFIFRDATDTYMETQVKPVNLRDIAVGAADLEHYEDALSPLEARVRIKWSAQGPGDREPRHRQSVLFLVTQPAFEEGAGFAEHSCGTCGAPLPETDAESCAYCRSPIQSKNKDWLLDKVETTVE